MGDYRRDELEQDSLIAGGVIYDRGCSYIRVCPQRGKHVYSSCDTGDHVTHMCKRTTFTL